MRKRLTPGWGEPMARESASQSSSAKLLLQDRRLFSVSQPTSVGSPPSYVRGAIQTWDNSAVYRAPPLRGDDGEGNTARRVQEGTADGVRAVGGTIAVVPLRPGRHRPTGGAQVGPNGDGRSGR